MKNLDPQTPIQRKFRMLVIATIAGLIIAALGCWYAYVKAEEREKQDTITKFVSIPPFKWNTVDYKVWSVNNNDASTVGEILHIVFNEEFTSINGEEFPVQYEYSYDYKRWELHGDHFDAHVYIDNIRLFIGGDTIIASEKR